MSSEPTFELFHAIADEASARVRRYVLEHDLAALVRFRNVTYPEVMADLQARGGGPPPALWDGHRLSQGAEAVIARLGVSAAASSAASSAAEPQAEPRAEPRAERPAVPAAGSEGLDSVK